MEKIIFEKVGLRLKQARELRNITLEEAGKKVDVHKSTVLRWENGETEKIKFPVIEMLASFYNVNPVWLMGYDVPMEREYKTKENLKFYGGNTNDKRLFPVLGEVKAGYDYLSSENIIGYISIDKNLGDPENYYALKIVGDSMSPILNEDDIVVVHKQNDVENGNVAIILIDDEEATIKRVYKTDKGIRLEAFNPYYPTKEFTKEEIKNKPVKIIGKVVEGRIKKIFE